LSVPYALFQGSGAARSAATIERPYSTAARRAFVGADLRRAVEGKQDPAVGFADDL
jgi:hypothetical protein